MSVDIGQVIEEGGKRTIARNGLYLVAISWGLGVVNQLLGNTVARGFMSQVPGGMPQGGQFGQPAIGPSLGLPPSIAWLLSLVAGAVGIVVVLGAFRTFVSEDTESLPPERFSRNLVWAWLNLFIGWIVFWIVVGIGFVFLVIPGLFLLVSLLFWGVYVAVEDQNFIEGFQNSWGLTGGNRLMLFVTGVVVVIVALIVSWIFGVPQIAGLTGWIGLLISQIGSAFGLVFVLATIARTYRQLTEESAAAAE